MEFCDKCGGLLIPVRRGRSTVLVCRVCGRRKAGKIPAKGFKLAVTGPRAASEVVVIEKKSRLETLPRTVAQCPKCEHREAFWWMQQTRGADEPPTRFYRCAKCGHVWREYE